MDVINSKFRSLGVISLLQILLFACAPASPWSNDVPKKFTNLTEKNISKLGQGLTEFGSFKIGLIADPQVFPGMLDKTIQQLNNTEGLHFYLILGDLTDRSFKEEFEWVAESIAKANRPIMTVVGNHDGLLYGGDFYQKMFGPLNYGFTYNQTRFLMWNNNPYEWGYPDFDWLENEIETHDRVVIGSHQAPGKIERFPDANERFTKIINHEHVIGSMHGHTHSFKIDWLKGKPVFTVARVQGVQYGIATITNNSMEIQKCVDGQCVSFK